MTKPTYTYVFTNHAGRCYRFAIIAAGSFMHFEQYAATDRRTSDDKPIYNREYSMLIGLN